MAFSFGFYNALDHDRKYDAVQVSMIFDGIINDGVYATVGKAFVAKEHPTSKNMIIVQSGRAWFDHTWNYNDSNLTFEIPQSDMTRKRIDALVFDINSDEASRTNEIKWVKGTPALSYPSKPTLLKEPMHKQYPICYVTREPNSERVYQYNIENAIGTPECPFVTGPLKVISLDELLGQWRSELDRFIAQEEGDFSDWKAEMEGDFETWSTQQKSDFSDWKAEMEGDFETWSTQQQTDFETWSRNEKTTFAEWMETEQNEFITWRDNEKTTFAEWMLNEKTLFDDWRDQEQTDFSTWRTDETTNWTTWKTSMETQMQALSDLMTSWAAGERTDWDAWFASIVDTLDSDTAGKLQNQINALKELEFMDYYSMEDRSTDISEDNQHIETTTPRAVVTTDFDHTADGLLRATRMTIPTDANYNWNYRTTTVFAGNNRHIETKTEKIPK